MNFQEEISYIVYLYLQHERSCQVDHYHRCDNFNKRESDRDNLEYDKIVSYCHLTNLHSSYLCIHVQDSKLAEAVDRCILEMDSGYIYGLLHVR